jgi:hypothetical protein
MSVKINYTLPSGKTAVITVEPKKGFNGKIFADVTARVAGVQGIPEMGLAQPFGLPTWAVSAIGRLPLTNDVDAAVRMACASVEAEYAEANDRASAHFAELDAISANTRQIARRMAI